MEPHNWTDKLSCAQNKTKHGLNTKKYKIYCLFVCVEVLRPSQPNGVMSSMVGLPNHTFTGQA